MALSGRRMESMQDFGQPDLVPTSTALRLYQFPDTDIASDGRIGSWNRALASRNRLGRVNSSQK